MKHYPNTVQNNETEINRFIQEMKMATLTTYNQSSSIDDIESGVFNPVFINNKYYLHLNRTDSQVKTMLETKKAKLTYFDFLCNIPSYWIDTDDGGVATSYYRHLDLFCDVKIYQDEKSLSEMLEMFLIKFQPEGGYQPINLQNKIYHSDFKVLVIAELVPYKQISKWKLGQNRDISKRLEIIDKLNQRNEQNDKRAAFEVSNWINKYNC